jgi:hypothetical protein
VDRYGALGPSLDYSNPADPPDMPIQEDGDLVFTVSTCNHGEIPLVPEGEMNLEAILEDQGFFPPPWARFPATFNLDIYNETSLEEDEDIADVYQGDFTPYMERLLAANSKRSFKKSKHGFMPKSSKDLQSLLTQKKPIGYTESGKLFSMTRAAEELGLNTTNLLAKNAKLSKGGKLCYLTAGLMLAPYTLSKVANLCPYATKGCSTGCLHVSGQAELQQIASRRAKEIDDVKDARIRRTLLLLHNNELFAKLFVSAMQSWANKAAKPFEACDTHELCGRLNVLSDLPWERMTFPFEEGEMTIFERYPDTIWYDYTKNPHRMMEFLDHVHGRGGNWPDNYYLTFSWSEVNAETAFEVMQAGGNVAIAFDVYIKHRSFIPDLPDEYCGFQVINADEHDLRFLDYEEGHRGVFCGLHLKGRQNFDRHMKRKRKELHEGLPKFSETGGFFQYAKDAGVIDGHYDPSMNISNSRSFVEEIIDGARMRAEDQRVWHEVKMQKYVESAPWWLTSEQDED